MLDGLRRGGVDLSEVDVIVGTSAGAIASAALAGHGLERALGLHREAALPRLEVAATTGELMAALMRAVSGAKDANDAVLRVANLPPVGSALVPEADVRSWFAAHLSAAAWPGERLLVTAVDAGSGERTVFGASSRVRLLDAVMASWAGSECRGHRGRGDRCRSRAGCP